MRERLGFVAAKYEPAGTLFVITTEDKEGIHFAISCVTPTSRSDVLKLTMVNYQGLIKELKLVETTHGILTDGKGEYCIWAATEKEVESGRMLMKKWGVRV